MSDPASPSPIPIARPQSGGRIEQAIARAADSSGQDFRYLLAQAKVESGLDPNAKAKTSSATGLFQFIESTWLRLAERHGPKMGLTGPIDLTDPTTRRDVLALRKDPQMASQMAALLAQENAAALAPVLGRQPDAGELYLAHFLGSGEATRFLQALGSNPDAPAAPIFARQAAANRPIFFDRSGQSRSLGDVMGVLRGRIEAAMPTDGEYSPPVPVPNLLPVQATIEAPYGAVTYSRSARAQMAMPTPQNWDAHSQPPLSRVLENQFNLGPSGRANSASGDHAHRVYSRLKAFGL